VPSLPYYITYDRGNARGELLSLQGEISGEKCPGDVRISTSTVSVTAIVGLV